MTDRCFLLDIIKDNIDDIFKILQNNIIGYDLTDTTKCLNTAVIITSLYLGTNANDIIGSCNVNVVQKRNKEIKYLLKQHNLKVSINFDSILVKQCMDELFDKNGKRRLFYIMITDATVFHNKNQNDSKVFPGHVFVVEKLSQSEYKLYQSYVSNYDLSGHFAKNLNSFTIDKERLQKFMTQVYYLYKDGTWNEYMTKAWFDITFINESQLNNYVFHNASYFCYRSVDLNTCTENLSRYVNGLQGYDNLKKAIQNISSK